MFSANPSISPTRLKPLDVAKGRRNRVGRGRKRNRMEGMLSDEGANGGSEGGLDRDRTGGSDWGDRIGGIRRGASSFGPTLCSSTPKPSASN